MKQTVIALISQDPDLQVLSRVLENREAETRSRMAFLQKQIEDVVKKKGQEDKADWAVLVKHLQGKGLLQDFNPDKMHIECNAESNAVTLCDHTDGGHHRDALSALLGTFF